MKSEWFKFMGASFLVKALNASQILALRDQVDKGKITQGEALQELFKSSLIGFKDIPGGKKISRQKKIEELFRDPEIRNFVLWMGYNLLTSEVEKMEKEANLMERFLFLTGRLKS
jgi:hypothetical protein